MRNWASVRSSLVSNATYISLTHVLGAGLGFAFWTLAARTSSPEVVGRAGAMIAASGFIGGLGSLGLGYGLTRYLPTLPLDVGNVLLKRAIAFVALLTAALAALAVLASMSGLVSSPFPSRVTWLLAGVLLATALAENSLLDQIFIGHLIARAALRRNIAMHAIRLLALAIVVLAPFGTPSAADLVGAAAVASTISWFLLFPRIAKLRGLATVGVWRRAEGWVPVLRYSLSNFWSVLFSGLPDTLLPMVIVYRFGSAEGGVFYVAWLVASLALAIGASVGPSLFAQASHSQGSGLYVASLIGAAAVGAALTAGSSILAPLLEVAVGSSYHQSVILLRILALAAPFRAVIAVGDAKLRIDNRLSIVGVLNGVWGGVVVALSLVLPAASGLLMVAWMFVVVTALTSAMTLAASGVWRRSIATEQDK